MTPFAAAAGVERHQLVERAALLERGRELVVLELEVDLRARDLGERPRVQAGRVHHLALDDPGRGADVVDRDRHVDIVP